jgi:precorrin-6B methylase 2
MNLIRVLSSVRDRYRRAGLSDAVGMLWERAYLRYQEQKYGIVTEAVISSADLGLGNPEFHDYGASDWNHLRAVIARLGLDHRQHVFVDFGAGMGRAMIAAAIFPFKTVIGVELSRDLARRAEQNVDRARRKLACRDIRVVNQDATTFEIGPEMTIFYFFNPFHGKTLDAVLGAIQASLNSTPRAVRLICRLPATSDFEGQLRQQRWLHEQFEHHLKSGVKYSVLESRPGETVT